MSDKPKRRNNREARKEWIARLARYDKVGDMTIREFCEREGVSQETFYWRRRKLRKERDQMQEEEPAIKKPSPKKNKRAPLSDSYPIVSVQNPDTLPIVSVPNIGVESAQLVLKLAGAGPVAIPVNATLVLRMLVNHLCDRGDALPGPMEQDRANSPDSGTLDPPK